MFKFKKGTPKYKIALSGVGALALPAIPLALAASCGDETVSPAQAAVNAEQTIVNKIATTPVNAVTAEGIPAFNALPYDQTIGTLLGIPAANFTPKVDKFSYELTLSKAVTTDGKFTFTIRVLDRTNPNVKGNPTNISGTLTGVLAKQHDVNVQFISHLTGTSLAGTAFTTATVAAGTRYDAAAATLKLVPALPLPYPSEVVTVAKAAGSNDLTFTYAPATAATAHETDFVAAAAPATGTGTVARTTSTVTVNAFAVTPVNAEQAKLAALLDGGTAVSKIALTAKADQPFTADIAKSFGITGFTPNSSFNYKYSTLALATSGNLTVTIKAQTKDTTPVSASTPTPVQTHMYISDKAGVDVEQARINHLTSTGITLTAPISAVTSPTAFDWRVANSFNMNGFVGDAASADIISSGAFEYKYTHPALAANGNLAVTVTVFQKGSSTIKGTPTAINVPATFNIPPTQAEVDAEQARVDKFAATAPVTHAIDGVTDATFNQTIATSLNFGTVTLSPGRFDYKVSFSSIEKSGTLLVTITVSSRTDAKLVGTPKKINVSVQIPLPGEKEVEAEIQSIQANWHTVREAVGPFTQATDLPFTRERATAYGYDYDKLPIRPLFIYSVSHQAVTAAGQMTVTFKVYWLANPTVFKTTDVHFTVRIPSEQVNTEQTLINHLTSTGITTNAEIPAEANIPFTAGVATRLGITGFTPKAAFTYTADIDGATTDGAMKVRITVHDAQATSISGTPTDISIQVQGIIEAKTDAEVLRIVLVEPVLPVLGPISGGAVNHAPLDEEWATKLGYNFASLGIDTSEQSLYLYTVSFPARTSSDHSIPVTFEVQPKAKPTFTASVVRHLAYEEEVSQAVVNTQQQTINGLHSTGMTVGVAGVMPMTKEPFTVAMATKLGITGFAPDLTKFNYWITTRGTASNGDMYVEITVTSLKGLYHGTPTPITVAVTGIPTGNNAPVDATQAEVNTQQQTINGLHSAGMTAGVAGVLPMSKEPFTAAVATKLGMTVSLDLTKFRYWITTRGITSNGDMYVEITVTSISGANVGTPTPITVPVTGIPTGNNAPADATQAEVDTQQQTVNGLHSTGMTVGVAGVLPMSKEPFTVAMATKLGITVSLDLAKFKYWITTRGITSNGDMYVEITVTSLSGAIHGTPTPITVPVRGIIEALVTAEQARVNAFTQTAGITVTNPVVAVSNANFADVTAAHNIGFDLSVLNLNLGLFTYTYSTPAMSTAGGSSVTITVHSAINPGIHGTATDIHITVS